MGWDQPLVAVSGGGARQGEHLSHPRKVFSKVFFFFFWTYGTRRMLLFIWHRRYGLNLFLSIPMDNLLSTICVKYRTLDDRLDDRR